MMELACSFLRQKKLSKKKVEDKKEKFKKENKFTKEAERTKKMSRFFVKKAFNDVIICL
jgi:hypothetical protein